MKLFVGGLPPSVTKQELEIAFSEFMPYIRIDLRRRSGSSLNKGYAFLLVNDPVIANRIVATEFEIRHRKLQVQRSKKVPKSQSVAPLRLYCRGIPADVNDDELTNFFKEFVDCRAAYSIKDSLGNQKTYGFIEVFSKESSRTLLAIKTFKLKDTHVIVEEFSRLIRSKPLDSLQTTKRLDNSIEFHKNMYESQKFRFPTNNELNVAELKHKNICVSFHNTIFTHQESASRTEVWRPLDEPLEIDNQLTSNIWQREPKKPGHSHLSSSIEKVKERPYRMYETDNPSKKSLIKIGNVEYIYRTPLADFIASSEKLDHEQENMRFNILKRPAINMMQFH